MLIEIWQNLDQCMASIRNPFLLRYISIHELHLSIHISLSLGCLQTQPKMYSLAVKNLQTF